MKLLDILADWFILGAIVFGVILLCGLLVAILEKLFVKDDR